MFSFRNTKTNKNEDTPLIWSYGTCYKPTNQVWSSNRIQEGETYVIQNSEKDYRFLRKWPFKTVSHFYYYFRCFDEKKNKLRECTKDESKYLPIWCTYILSSLRTLRHNSLMTLSNCTRLSSTMKIRLCIKFANINALFLVTYADLILVIVRTTEWKMTAT